MRRAHTSLVPVRVIFDQVDKPGEAGVRAAINRLIERGWIIAEPSLAWTDEHEIALFGDGLHLAMRLAGEGDDAAGS